MSVRSVQNMTLQGGGVERSLSPSSDLVGDFEAIATITVGAGGASSIEFTSIPGTYQHLQVRGIFRTTRNTLPRDYVTYHFNSDTGSNYARHELSGDGGSAAASGATSGTYLAISSVTSANTSLSNAFGAGVVDILDYASTAKYKTTRAFCGMDANGQTSTGEASIRSGLWMNTSAVTSILLKASNGAFNFAQHSTVALYGVRA